METIIRTIKSVSIIMLVFVLAFSACEPFPPNEDDTDNDNDTAINISAITGVTPPVIAGTPKTTITATAQYTGTITWSPNHTDFAASTVYTATITLSAKSGFTFQGVTTNFFTVNGAVATNTANSGVVTAVFPATGANDVAVNIAAITGVTPPVVEGTPATSVTETDQYTGTVEWSPSHTDFAASTVYTATITLAAKSGFTFQGVTPNFFTVDGALATNQANSGVVTAIFPATEAIVHTFTTVDSIISYLNSLSLNTAASPYHIKANLSSFNTTDVSTLKTAIANKYYVNIDFSESTFTSIANNAFENTYQLTGITFPATGFTAIGESAFANCTNLTNIAIPASVTSIGENAFDCKNLTVITVDAANATYSSVDGVLYNKAQTTLIQYPQKKAGAAFTIPATVTNIGKTALFGCANLTSITFPVSGFTTIGESAFEGCEGLVSVTIPNSVTSIGINAFTDCAGLTSVSLPNITSIGIGVFKGCSSLESITIPNTVTTIGNYAFEDCASLASLNIPNSVNSITQAAFSGCSNLTRVVFPKVGITLSEDTFSGDLRTKYQTGGAGTYTRPSGSDTWTKQ